MKILGIDPGLRVCGYAVMETGTGNEKLVEAGVFKSDESKGLAERLNQIARDAGQILDKHSPAIVAVEELYSNYKHPKTAILMGHARGVILCKAVEAGRGSKELCSDTDKEIIDRQRKGEQRADAKNDPAGFGSFGSARAG